MTSTTRSAASSEKRRVAAIAARVRLWLPGVAAGLLVGLYLVVGVLWVFVAPLKLTTWAISTGWLAAEVAVVVLCMVPTLAGLWWAFRSVSVRGGLRREAILRIVTVVGLAIASFSALTAVLYHEGAVTVRGGAVREDNVIDKASEFYVWHVVNSVPLLDIPKNLRWEQPFEFEDRVGGLVLMLFAGAVLLPLIPGIRVAAARPPRDDYEVAVLKVLRKNARGWRVRPPRDRHSQHVAAVESGGTRILVDAVSELPTVEAALGRLHNAPTLLLVEAGGPARNQDFSFAVDEAVEGGAYLLVAGAVDNATRERVEPSFRESDIPCRLAVWPSGEPDEELAKVVEDFLGELRPAAKPAAAF
jgi:hypothetical protein